MIEVPRQQLRPGYAVSRLFKGNWQLSGDHGPVNRQDAINDLFAFVDAGITTFDGADIYAGVEALLGEFRRRFAAERGAEATRALKFHTKFVPDRDSLDALRRRDVERIIDRSCERLGVERLDLVQFHWWDYAQAGLLDAYGHLQDLRSVGKIDQIGTTNFDLAHLQKMQSHARGLLSAQVQYSLLDRRPAGAFAAWCAGEQISLFCYGVLAGGFLTDRWLGRPDPGFAFENRSLVKYRLVIEDGGGWAAFQKLLECCAALAARHGVTIAAVAMRAMLQNADVAAVIVGARYRAHLDDTVQVFRFELDDDDIAQLQSVEMRSPGGAVYGLERDPASEHSQIMKYNLNEGDPNQLPPGAQS